MLVFDSWAHVSTTLRAREFIGSPTLQTIDLVQDYLGRSSLYTIEHSFSGCGCSPRIVDLRWPESGHLPPSAFLSLPTFSPTFFPPHLTTIHHNGGRYREQVADRSQVRPVRFSHNRRRAPEWPPRSHLAGTGCESPPAAAHARAAWLQGAIGYLDSSAIPACPQVRR